MSTTHNQTSTRVLSLHSDTQNGHNTPSYPPAEAKYEEVAQSSDLFWEKLKAFHKALGTKFIVPTVGGKALDLHHLFVEVTSRGGIEKVVRDRKWKEVIVLFQFPSTITSASFVLRKYYLSLLYNFEQVYFFQKQVPSDTTNQSLVYVSGPATIEEEGATKSHLPDQGNQTLQIGSSVAGIIDGKFDNGYLVTVDLGSIKLRGVLYHFPSAASHVSGSSYTSAASSRRRRKRSWLALRDPSHPKSNRSGYNFFFAEHYARLKPMHHGQERVISKKIGVLWNNLTDAEKQAYKNIPMLRLTSSIAGLSGERVEGQGEI
ncbi:high mobility group B protein 10 isoform X2 [Tripterygium wilfordii]|uniref:high mobility group B protein 10 isoform X2 n=1 Tax=Tripterygium wilfordii TaxID=458696 RepID=UPI0018F849DE|nr:high mobility group B protein 10 isoform X2 [Tripterygium wilfordii]